MNRTKYFLIVLVSVIFLVCVVGIPIYLENQKQIKVNEERKSARAEEIKKNNVEIYNSLVKTIEDNKQLINSDPNNFNAWTDLGTAQQRLGDYIEAEKSYRQAIKISKQGFIPYNNLANIYKDKGEYDKAKATYLEMLESQPGEISGYLSLAQMYVENKAGNVQDAAAILEKGLAETKSQAINDALNKLRLTGKLE